MPAVAQSERAELCDLFLEVGSRAPTLCGDWTTGDLAAHLIVRERHPLSGIGIVFSPMAGLTERSMASQQARHSFEELVDLVRSGPPPPMRWVDDAVNTVEYFVHYEDVRRAGGDVAPRAGIDDVDDAVWGRLGLMAGLLARGMKGAGLTLVRTDDEDRIGAKKGEPQAELRGTPGELVLYLYGRQDQAVVELTGDNDAVEAVRQAKFGF